MYKIETHLHTNHVSKCGWLDAEHLAKKYYESGFSGIAVTDHYNMDTWAYKNVDITTDKRISETFLEGYHKMQEACAKYGIQVYMGAELRFFENQNDYLFYNFDPALLDDAEAVINMGVVQFSREYRPQETLLIQAHPFRNKCVPIPSYLLDGVEVENNNPRHNSRNALAVEYAEHDPRLIRIAGSDCHRPGDEGTAGILSETLPQSTAEFAALLRSGAFELIK
ncbi:MAG: PHP domain-containing protein [Butyricicoccus sp.]|nr:PHP domain-containing protein [Butyricicoccus sp.]MBQ8585567.1 PHP domain-containing protein [Butyricicoccus sp.]MBR3867150.1 PHP domain-containing protein [Butyricicoccus sp.]